MKRPDKQEYAAYVKWAARFYGLPAKELPWDHYEQYDRVWLSGYRAGQRSKRKRK